MFCENCGAKLEDDAMVCPQCGQAVAKKGKKSKSTDSRGVNNQLFISPDETLIATLGNGFAENLLYENIKSCRALLTDKRVYFQGIFYSVSGKNLSTQKEEMIVDLEDITGTKFRYSASVMKKIIISLLIPIVLWFLFGLLSAPASLGPQLVEFGSSVSRSSGSGSSRVLYLEIFSIIYSVLTYLKGRTTYFAIEYAGGSICFDATIVGLAEVRDLQKQIRRAKDALKGK